MDTIADKKMGKKKIIIICLIVIFAIVCVAGVAGYFVGEHYYATHFLKGTVIHGIDVSGLSVDELNEKIKDYTLSIRERDADGEIVTEVLKGTDIGLTFTTKGELEEILEGQQGGRWIFGSGEKYDMEEITEYDEDAWEKVMNQLQCFDEKFVTEPQNAYVETYVEESGEFVLADEVEGNKLDRSKAEKTLSEAVIVLADEVSLEECYEKPEVTSQTKELKDFYEKLTQYAGVKITYTFGEEVEELNGIDICKWLNIDYENYAVTLDTEKVSSYVAYLRRHHDTIFGTRTFQTTSGVEVTIEGGDYGWWMNREEETAELVAMIEAGESGERTPVYYQKAASYDAKDYGDTYVEINLTAQHLYLYVDGVMLMESDFVSGLPGSHATPAGTYAVTYTQKYAVLRGDTYETMVSFWMPFNEDIGLHDATWQSQLGGTLYKSIGSHGCVNLPYNFAKALFPYVEQGMPIICYHLPGTESQTVTAQSDEEKAQSVIDAINEIATASKPARQTANARMLYKQLSGAAKAKVTNYADLLSYEAQY